MAMSEAERRKGQPVWTGVLNYFPDAIRCVAELSRVANEQHSPGEPVHWAKGKSTDHADSLARHLLDIGGLDTDGQRHTAKVAWRALALLQEEVETHGPVQAQGYLTVNGFHILKDDNGEKV
jgi:hypothetical protein